MDSLALLRLAISAGRLYKLIDSQSNECDTIAKAATVALPAEGSQAFANFAKDSPTKYRTSPDSDETFTLEAIVTAYELRNLSISEYLQASTIKGFRFVGVTERSRLVQYLKGEIATVPNVTDGDRDRGQVATSNQDVLQREYIVNTEDIALVMKIRSYEREVQTCQSVLHGHRKGNFENVQKVIADRMAPSKDSSAMSQRPDSAPRVRRGKNVYPIIMLSSSPSAILNLLNIKKFLEDGIYEHPDQAREQMRAELGRDIRTENVVIVNHKRGERVMRYMVVDSVQALYKFGSPKDAWDRVVAVFTTGQEWQFKPYLYSDPKTLFQQTKGFYALWTNEGANPKVKDWNVSELRIDRQRRHTDKALVANFWRIVEAWQSMHKAALFG